MQDLKDKRMSLERNDLRTYVCMYVCWSRSATPDKD